MNELNRKASGLDAGHSGRVPFIRVMPSLRRSPRVVEAEEVPDDPLDGFEI
jgi:hypothetical protein